MKKVLPLLVIGIFVLSGLGAVAIDSNNENTKLKTNENVKIISNDSPRDYTHTVFVEVGTATWCPSCPASNTAWHSIYESGDHDFEYTELVSDKNTKASQRFNQFNPRYVPTSYWDGGQYVLPGTNTATFRNYLDASGSRSVQDLVANLEVTWNGNAEIDIDYIVNNNEGSSYGGRLRIYIIELESTHYNDYSGNPYYHGFLDFAENKDINIPGSGSISDSTTWDGNAAGFPSVTKSNLQVILAVFNDEGHQSYSDPPSGNPFTAYYSDECIAVSPGGSTNDPPTAPEIAGPSMGTEGESYDFTFTSTDPDGDDIKYYIEWGDGHTDRTGFEPSGTTVTESHTWDKSRTFTITARAEDTAGAKSGWSTFDIIIPRNRQINNFLQYLCQRFSYEFPLLRQILKSF
jgi:hypothetical protein